MAAMETMFDLPVPGRSLFIALLLALLVVLMFWLIRDRRRFGRVGLRTARDSQLRLAVIDAAAVDRRRRLVLIRRDDIEHLLMTGGPADIVVEQNIVHQASVPSPDEAHVLRRPRLHGILSAADAAISSEPEFRPSRAKPPSNSDPPLRMARARELAVKMEPLYPALDAALRAHVADVIQFLGDWHDALGLHWLFAAGTSDNRQGFKRFTTHAAIPRIQAARVNSSFVAFSSRRAESCGCDVFATSEQKNGLMDRRHKNT